MKIRETDCYFSVSSVPLQLFCKTWKCLKTAYFKVQKSIKAPGEIQKYIILLLEFQMQRVPKFHRNTLISFLKSILLSAQPLQGRLQNSGMCWDEACIQHAALFEKPCKNAVIHHAFDMSVTPTLGSAQVPQLRLQEVIGHPNQGGGLKGERGDPEWAQGSAARQLCRQG